MISAKSVLHEPTTNNTFMVHQSQTYMHPQQWWEKIINYCFNFKQKRHPCEINSYGQTINLLENWVNCGLCKSMKIEKNKYMGKIKHLKCVYIYIYIYIYIDEIQNIYLCLDKFISIGLFFKIK